MQTFERRFDVALGLQREIAVGHRTRKRDDRACAGQRHPDTRDAPRVRPPRCATAAGKRRAISAVRRGQRAHRTLPRAAPGASARRAPRSAGRRWRAPRARSRRTPPGRVARDAASRARPAPPRRPRDRTPDRTHASRATARPARRGRATARPRSRARACAAHAAPRCGRCGPRRDARSRGSARSRPAPTSSTPVDRARAQESRASPPSRRAAGTRARTPASPAARRRPRVRAKPPRRHPVARPKQRVEATHARESARQRDVGDGQRRVGQQPLRKQQPMRLRVFDRRDAVLRLENAAQMPARDADARAQGARCRLRPARRPRSG